MSASTDDRVVTTSIHLGHGLSLWLTRQPAGDTVERTIESSATEDEEVELGRRYNDSGQERRPFGTGAGVSQPAAQEGSPMPAESFADTPRHRPEAALTPRPIRLLLVGRVKPGAEPALRELQARFPREAAAEAGIDAFEAFIGSGQYAVEFEISRHDVQQVLATFFNDPRIREFRGSIEPFVEGLPGPDYRFGAAYHSPEGGADTAPAATVYNTGDLHFAASMYRWRAGEAPETGAEPRGGGLVAMPSAGASRRQQGHAAGIGSAPAAYSPADFTTGK